MGGYVGHLADGLQVVLFDVFFGMLLQQHADAGEAYGVEHRGGIQTSRNVTFHLQKEAVDDVPCRVLVGKIVDVGVQVCHKWTV